MLEDEDRGGLVGWRGRGGPDGDRPPYCRILLRKIIPAAAEKVSRPVIQPLRCPLCLLDLRRPSVADRIPPSAFRAGRSFTRPPALAAVAVPEGLDWAAFPPPDFYVFYKSLGTDQTPT
jgi:hypothetical protein